MQLGLTVAFVVFCVTAVTAAAAYFIDRGVRREEENSGRES